MGDVMVGLKRCNKNEKLAHKYTITISGGNVCEIILFLLF